MCGILGISNIKKNETKTLAYYAMQALQHRGQESAGIAWHTKNSIMAYSTVTQGSVEKLFTNHDMTSTDIQTLVGHTRYSTTGGDTHTNVQPFLFKTTNGYISLVHNGNLNNTTEVRSKVIAMGMKPNGTTDSELIGLLITRYLEEEPNGGMPSAIQFASKICKGAISLIISTNSKIYGYRDSYGIRPLVIGLLEEYAHIIASETCALDTIGATYIKDVRPGTVIEISNNSHHEYKLDISKPPRRCIFEDIYFSRPDSLNTIGQYNVNNNKSTELYPSIYEYRLELGRRLAIEHPADADIVIGTPDSGIPGAIGMAEASGITYREGLIKNKYIGRTFIQPTQKMREQGVRVKLNPIPNVLKGKRIILVDDSIVRGNTCRRTIEALRKAGAVEVHMRVTSPPVKHPCYFGLDFPDTEELAACNMTHKQLTKFIEADSVGYLSLDNCLEATNYVDNHYYDNWGPHTGYCTACFSGEYPV